MTEFTEATGIEGFAEDESQIVAAPGAHGSHDAVETSDVRLVADDVSSGLKQSAASLPLTEGVSELSETVAELKAQLRHFIEVNAALESELDAARQQASDEIQARERLVERIEGYERALTAAEQTHGKLEQARQERDILAAKVTDLSQALTNSEQRVDELGQIVSEYRAERNTASEEAACLESQFARAVKVIEGLRQALGVSQERENECRSSMRVFKEQMEEAVVERDSAKAELCEAREALECIRQSILAAGRDAQKGHFEDRDDS